MRRAAAVALGLWIGATPALAQDLGPGAPPVSAAVRDAVAEARGGVPSELMRLAEAGRPDAQFYAGVFLVLGPNGVSKNGAKGCGYLEAASASRADAMHALGEFYEQGRCGETDLEKAILTFHKAGDMGLAKSRCAEGNVLIKLGRDQARAVSLCQQGAEGGDADAQTDLGNFYLTGQHVKRDPAVARRWYEKAAAQGHANATYTLGQIYWNGDGVQKDTGKAAELWRRAWDRGRIEAALHLGDEAFLRAGRGEKVWDPAGLDEAAGWYDKAVEVPNPDIRKLAIERRDLARQLAGAMRRRN